jgi:hypothetical protein
MRALGFNTQQLGPDGETARALAQQWNAQWDVARRGHKASDELIVAAGWKPEQADEVRAYEILRNMEALAERFEKTAAAAYLAKGMRGIARDLDRAAKLAAANATHRDVLHVAS